MELLTCTHSILTFILAAIGAISVALGAFLWAVFYFQPKINIRGDWDDLGKYKGRK